MPERTPSINPQRRQCREAQTKGPPARLRFLQRIEPVICALEEPERVRADRARL